MAQRNTFTQQELEHMRDLRDSGWHEDLLQYMQSIGCKVQKVSEALFWCRCLFDPPAPFDPQRYYDRVGYLSKEERQRSLSKHDGY